MASAEPYIAVRTGFTCNACHVNHTGGGMRNEFGTVYAQTQLYMTMLKYEHTPNFAIGKLNDSITMGANLRVEEVDLLEYEGDSGDKLESVSDSRVSEANLYVNVALVPNSLALYIDQTLSPTSATREFFGIMQGLPFHSYVKVGQMFLPYGMRLLDDNAFIRNRTGFTFKGGGTAVEVGFEPASHLIAANITNDRLSLIGSVAHRWITAGASYSRNTEHRLDWTAGVFGGFNYWKFTIIGEADVIQEGGTDRLATLVEANFLPRQGLNLKSTYEFFDRNRDISYQRDGQERISFGIEPVLTPFVQVAAFYRINRFIPQNLAGNQDEVLIQFHLFF